MAPDEACDSAKGNAMSGQRTTERQREIEQGLREPSGSLIGGLDVLEYVKGHEDFDAGIPPPSGVTATSYDLGRKRAAEDAERTADILRAIEDRRNESISKVRELLADKPDLLAEFNTRMEALK